MNFLEMDIMCVHLFLYTEIVQKKQNKFYKSANWQNFT